MANFSTEVLRSFQLIGESFPEIGAQADIERRPRAYFWGQLDKVWNNLKREINPRNSEVDFSETLKKQTENLMVFWGNIVRSYIAEFSSRDLQSSWEGPPLELFTNDWTKIEARFALPIRGKLIVKRSVDGENSSLTAEFNKLDDGSYKLDLITLECQREFDAELGQNATAYTGKVEIKNGNIVKIDRTTTHYVPDNKVAFRTNQEQMDFDQGAWNS